MSPLNSWYCIAQSQDALSMNPISSSIPFPPLSACGVLHVPSWMTLGKRCHPGPWADLHPTALVIVMPGGPLALAEWSMLLCAHEPSITQPNSMRCGRNIRLEGTVSTACQQQTSKWKAFDWRMPFLLHTYKSRVNKFLTLLAYTSKLLCGKPKLTGTNCLRLIHCFVVSVLIMQTIYLPWKM